MAIQLPDRLSAPSRMKLDVVALAERDAGTDFKKAVHKILGKLDWQVLHSDVLVATYIRPRKTSGGIILPEKSVDEDRYQAKVGLVLKLGPAAFKYTRGAYAYEGPVPKVGDYVTFHTSDAREVGFRGVSLKYIVDELVRAIVPDEDVDSIY